MAKYRAQRGLGHLLSLSLFRGSMPIPGPGSDTGGNLSVAENILSLVFDHNFTIDCIDVRPARCVKLQDMKQFPIKPDCAPTPHPAASPPATPSLQKQQTFISAKPGPEQVNTGWQRTQRSLARLTARLTMPQHQTHKAST